MAFVYILQCADGSYYVGSTRATLEARINDHNAGRYGGYTESRRPVKLVWAEEFQYITDAIAMERRVKGWRRVKKEALIAKNYDAIRDLASRRKKLKPSSFETAAARPPQDEDSN
jgi:putative endonuclease